MGEQVASSSRIAESMRRPIQDYADLIQQLAGDRAQSLTLFGAIISDSFDPSHHTARSVLVLDAVDLALLRKIALQGAKLGKARISAPLVMTPAYIPGWPGPGPPGTDLRAPRRPCRWPPPDRPSPRGWW